MSHIEKTSLWFICVLTGQMIVNGKVQVLNVSHQMVALLRQCQMVKFHQMGSHFALLRCPVELSMQMANLPLLMSQPRLFIGHFLQLKRILIKDNVDVLHLQLLQVEIQLTLRFLHRVRLLGLGLVALKGIYHELEIGCTVLWLIQTSPHSIDLC